MSIMSFAGTGVRSVNRISILLSLRRRAVASCNTNSGKFRMPLLVDTSTDTDGRPSSINGRQYCYSSTPLLLNGSSSNIQFIPGNTSAKKRRPKMEDDVASRSPRQPPRKDKKKPRHRDMERMNSVRRDRGEHQSLIRGDVDESLPIEQQLELMDIEETGPTRRPRKKNNKSLFQIRGHVDDDESLPMEQQLEREINGLSTDIEETRSPRPPRKNKNCAPPNHEVENRPYKKPTANALQGPYSLFVSCLPGLEPLLLQEVEYLRNQWSRFTIPEEEEDEESEESANAVRGGVKINVPTLAHLYTLHLYLGTASHIYMRLNDGDTDTTADDDDDDDDYDGGVNNDSNLPPLFRARGFPELKRKMKDLIKSQLWGGQLLILPSRSKSKKTVDARHLSWQLQVHVTTSKSKLMHTKAVEERVRDAIGEVLGIDGLNAKTNDNDIGKKSGGEKKGGKDSGKKKGGSAAGDKDKPVVRLLVRIDRDVVQISLDTSTSSSANFPMHMRGYRLDPFKAPLREDLAFALLMAGGLTPAWDLQPKQSLPSSRDDDDDDSMENKNMESTPSEVEEAAAALVKLFDPLCGSGTIAIEGASILAGLPPGRFRPPPLQGTKLCNPKLWNAMKSKALAASLYTDTISSKQHDDEKQTTSSSVLVAANDINKKAIDAAKSNAERAGVDRFINFKVGSFKIHPLLKRTSSPGKSKQSKMLFELSQSQEPLLVVTNPPYGKRLPSSSPSSASSDTSKKELSIHKQIAQALRSSQRKNMQCTMIGGKGPRPLRESSLPLEVVFSSKSGGLNVVAMTGAVDE